MCKEVTDSEFEKALSNINYIKIMNKVSSKYCKSIHTEELEAQKLLVLWNCLKNFNPDKNLKFTSYLYQRLDWEYKRILKERNREQEKIGSYEFQHRRLPVRNGQYKHNTRQQQGRVESIEEMIESLGVELKKVMIQKFLHNMTIEEIGRENHYSREKARRLIKQGIKKLQTVEQNAIRDSVSQ